MNDIVISYKNSMQLLVTVQICTGMHSRGCTGFDGLTADGEAVRGRTPRKKFDLKLNAEDNLALAA